MLCFYVIIFFSMSMLEKGKDIDRQNERSIIQRHWEWTALSSSVRFNTVPLGAKRSRQRARIAHKQNVNTHWCLSVFTVTDLDISTWCGGRTRWHVRASPQLLHKLHEHTNREQNKTSATFISLPPILTYMVLIYLVYYCFHMRYYSGVWTSSIRAKKCTLLCHLEKN